jgi:hypothetical protein
MRPLHWVENLITDNKKNKKIKTIKKIFLIEIGSFSEKSPVDEVWPEWWREWLCGRLVAVKFTDLLVPLRAIMGTGNPTSLQTGSFFNLMHAFLVDDCSGTSCTNEQALFFALRNGRIAV